VADPFERNLVKKLHFLRNRASHEFIEAQEALNAWAGAKLSCVTSIAPDQLPQFQGQMQGIETILGFLQESANKPVD
jgi:hypothetical protein